jgi:regulator of nucleoside diphosphate kinase
MIHELPLRARELPAITIPASDYDRLAELAETAPAAVAPYLRRELARARIAADFDLDPHIARVGSRITYREEPSHQARTVELVWPHEADISRGRVSVLTAIGAALIGMGPGDSIDFPAPVGGHRRVRVMAVTDGGAPGPAAA